MSLPSRYKAVIVNELGVPPYIESVKHIATQIVQAYADSTLKTHDEFMAELDSPMSITVAGSRKMHGGHWELRGYSNFKWPSAYGTEYLLIPKE